MASFDDNGLVIDRLADIKTEIQDELIDGFGTGIDLDERSPFGIVIGILSERYFLLWEILESVNDASYPDDSFGIQLDKLLAFNGIVREGATASVVDLTFTRVALSTGDIIIPAGTQGFADASTILWSTDVEVTILDGFDDATVQSTASQTGPVGALAATITNLVSTPANVDSVTNLLDATVGSAEETDAEVKARRRTQLGRSGTATASGIRSALNLLTEVRAAQLVVNDTDDVVDLQPAHSVAAFISVETGINLEQDSDLDFDSDLVTLNSCAIEVNGSPTTGSPIVFATSNALTMAAIATELETDALITTATVNVDNDKISVDGTTDDPVVITIVVTLGATQPIVTQTFTGTALDTIAQSLWDSKGAGIQTFGELQGTAVDAEGEDHTLFFSEIEAVPIEVEVTITSDSDYEPLVAEPAIQAAIVDYANTTLLPGVDVLSFKLLCAASDVGSAGIRTLDVGIRKTSVGGPFIDQIAISVAEFGTIDSTDITFV